VQYAAFLRGVNVGGHNALRMSDLRAALEGIGLSGVRTVLASGNILFETTDDGDAGGGPLEETVPLSDRIEAALCGFLGRPVEVAVRRMTDMRALVASDPFAGVPRTPATRLHVTFLSSAAGKRAELDARADPRIQLVRVTGDEVLTVIVLQPGWGTTELMAWLERGFGPGVTTRSWSTLLKVVSLPTAR